MAYYVASLQAWSVPEVLRPLYESSRVVAQKMTIAVSRNCFMSLIRFISIMILTMMHIQSPHLFGEKIVIICSEYCVMRRFILLHSHLGGSSWHHFIELSLDVIRMDRHPLINKGF